MENISRSLKIIYLFVSSLFLMLPSLALAEDKLLQSSDLTYLGVFKLPENSDLTNTFGGFNDNGSKGIAFNPAGNGGAGSLYVVGHPYYNYIGECSIPELYTGTNINLVPEGSVIQNMTDATEGNLARVDCDGHGIYGGGGSVEIGGLSVYNNKLIGTVFATYNANNETCYNSFSHNLVLSESSFDGMYQLGTSSPATPPSAGYFGGYMGLVPLAYQSLLGGPAITGNGMTSIISQTSNGPSLFSFDPVTFSGDNNTPISYNSLLYYQQGVHDTLGNWGETSRYLSINDKITGVVFPVGTRSVLFIGRHGTGVSCYGPATSTLLEAKDNAYILSHAPYDCSGVLMDGLDGDSCCYDTCDHSKGTHSYPYNYEVWAYDANDLAAVKAGTKSPWEPVPYAMWSLPLNFNSQGNNGFHVMPFGAAYDSTNQKIYIMQEDTDIVHVFHIDAIASSDATSPASPSGLVVW